MAKKNIRISSGINLSAASVKDLRAYMKDGIDMLKRVGFDALDLRADYVSKSKEKDKLDIMAEMKEYADSQNIAFEITHLPFGLGPNASKDQAAEFAKKVYTAIDASVILGAKYSVMHPISETVSAYEFNAQRDFEIDKAHLAPFIDYAAKKGLNIVVENMRLKSDKYYQGASSYIPIRRNCDTPEALCRLADSLGIGVCWDFGHANIDGITKQSEALSYIGKRLKVLHVNDNFGYSDEHLPPFYGNIDWDDVALGLSKAKFDGLFNYEMLTRRHPAELRETYAKYILEAAKDIVKKIK